MSRMRMTDGSLNGSIMKAISCFMRGTIGKSSARIWSPNVLSVGTMEQTVVRAVVCG